MAPVGVSLWYEAKASPAHLRIGEQHNMLSENQLKEIFSIGMDMYAAGVDVSLIIKAMHLGGKYEGVYDLMVMWKEETVQSERDLDIEELGKSIADIERFDI